MLKKTLGLVGSLVGLLFLYLLIAPVPIDPKSWQAPANPGYTGNFEVNDRLAELETLSISDYSGPEDVIADTQGNLYVSTHEGVILRLSPDDSEPEVFAKNLGRPLGLAFDQQGNLLVADAYLGLLSINPKGEIKVLLDSVAGKPLVYANNLDISEDGRIYFSEASSKFGAEENGGSYPASLLDLMEHGGHGRLMVFDPNTKEVEVLMSGLQFANGVALAHDESFVLVNETGNYRILKHWLKGSQQGQTEELVSELPAFPDNLNRGLNGLYWAGLVSPRNPLIDALSDQPFWRKVVQRFPAFMRPKATFYGHVVAFDDQGRIIHDLQDPSGAYPTTTSVFETENNLYIGSLTAKVLGRLKWNP